MSNSRKLKRYQNGSRIHFPAAKFDFQWEFERGESSEENESKYLTFLKRMFLQSAVLDLRINKRKRA